ncbi:MAG: translation elongation factor Ts [Planctomycetota bacterium]|nr:translation elongation factor Ts [Planctomycetota bacterium]
MTEINPKDVMALRNKTGLPMMDCKAALAEAKGDAAAAEEILRKKLKGKMDARTDRAAGEGRIAIAVSKDGKSAAIVEVRAESDFTAKNDKFAASINKVAELALAGPAGASAPTAAMTAAVDEVRIATGENCSVARVHKFEAADAVFGTYIHHDGKTGSLVQGKGSVSVELLREVAMHVVAAVPRPQGVSASEIPAAIVEKERKFRVDQAMESGKPKEIAEKMVEGQMRKFFEEIALLEQPFIKDPSKKVKDVIGSGGTVVAFARWQVGEQA